MAQRSEVLPVELENGVTIYAVVVPLDSEEDVALGVRSFVDVSKAIEGIASSIVSSLERLKPSAWKVEFGLNLGAKSGELTTLLVDGTSEATLKVTMEWKS